MNGLPIVITIKAAVLISGILFVIAGIYFAFTATPLMLGIGVACVGLLMILLTRGL